MDIKYSHGSPVRAIRACYYDDALDLLAVAGEESVSVLQCNQVSVEVIATFVIGLRVTALAWSSKTVSPSVSDDWCLELVVSTHDFGLHKLSKTPSGNKPIIHFGGGLTGHHGRITDLAFVGGQNFRARHVASVSEDKNLIVWDLYPSPDFNADTSSEMEGDSFDRSDHRQPTALVIPFALPLCSVGSHPSTSKELLVSDARGTVFLVDWRKDPSETDRDDDHLQNIVELVHPRALAESCTNLAKTLSGYASWHRDNANLIGAVFGSEFALWDLGNLRGGKPFTVGPCTREGGDRFRWCPSSPDFFATSSASGTGKGAAIQIHNVNHLNASATVITVAPRPHRVIDFDWLATRGTPRIAAAVGHDVLIFPISID